MLHAGCGSGRFCRLDTMHVNSYLPRHVVRPRGHYELKRLGNASPTALLPCCHIFHRACLVARDNGPIVCAVCRTAVAGDPAALPADPYAEAQLAVQVNCKACEQEGR